MTDLKYAFQCCLLAILLLSTANNVQGQTSANVKYLLRQAQIMSQKGDYEEALQDCDAAEKECPNCGIVNLERVYVYIDMKKYGKAERELKTARKRYPPNSPYIVDVSLDLKKSQHLIKEAYEELDKLIAEEKAEDKKLLWLKKRASLKMSNKDYKEAYADNCLIFQKDSSNMHRLAFMIMHEYHFDDTVKLNSHLKLLADLSRNSKLDTSHYFNDMAIIYSLQKKYQEAVNMLNVLLQKNPQDALANIEKAVYIAEGNLYTADSALYYADNAVKLMPNNAGKLENRGFVKIFYKQYESALVDLNKSIELNKYIPEAYNCIGYIYKLKGGAENEKLAKQYNNKAQEIGGPEYVPYWKY